MWRVAEGQKIKNVKDDNGASRHFYSGETLPKDYEPPKSFIEQKIVKEVKNGNRKIR